MKIKILLKFYFNAGKLNGKMDKFIEYNACRADGGGFGRVEELLGDKILLCSLMDYLCGIFKKLTAKDWAALEKYSSLRVGIRHLCDVDRREIKRAVTKFTRKLTYIGRHEKEVKALQKYRCII